MVIGELKLEKDRIIYQEEMLELNYLHAVDNFDNIVYEYKNADLTMINLLYNNVRCFKCYSKIIYSENRIGIEANNELMSYASRCNVNGIKSIEENGLNFVQTNEDIVAIFEDDDDNDPNTGFFYFICRI